MVGLRTLTRGSGYRHAGEAIVGAPGEAIQYSIRKAPGSTRAVTGRTASTSPSAP